MYPRDYYYDRYPSFVSGCSYVMTINTTMKILKAALSIEFLYLEDVFFNGVCAGIANINKIHNQGFNIPFNNYHLYNHSMSFNYITIHRVTPSTMYKIWTHNKIV